MYERFISSSMLTGIRCCVFMLDMARVEPAHAVKTVRAGRAGRAMDC
jgi:hypothetical protein